MAWATPLLQQPKALSWACLPTVTLFLSPEHTQHGDRLKPAGFLAASGLSMWQEVGHLQQKPTVGRGVSGHPGGSGPTSCLQLRAL